MAEKVDQEIITAITQAESDVSGLRTRWDIDWDFFVLTEHNFVDSQGKKFPKGYVYTSPLPRSLADSVAATLEEAKVSIVVESNTLSDEKITAIEQFTKDSWAAANEWAERFYGHTCDEVNHQNLPVRGVIITRLLAQVEDIDGEKQLVIDPQSWDARWSLWETGRDGWLAWGALKVQMTRSKALAHFGTTDDAKAKIEKAYPDAKRQWITDYWSPEVHKIFVANSLVFEEDNPWTFVPLIVTDSRLGTTLIPSSGSNEYTMESIYHTLRHVFKVENQIKSRDYSRGMEGYRSEMTATGEDTAAIKASLSNPPPRGGSAEANIGITVLPKDTKMGHLYPTDETKAADMSLQNAIDQDIQEARSMSPLVSQFNPKNPASGAALITLAADQRKSLVPMIKSLQNYRRQVFYMLRRMFKEGKISGPVGPQGRRSNYTWQQLEGDYSIEFKYMVTLPAETIAAYSLGIMATELGLPLEWVIDKILSVEEPKQLMSMSRLARMEKLSPRVMTLLAAQDALDENDQKLVKTLLAEFVVLSAELEATQAKYQQVLGPPQTGPAPAALPSGQPEFRQRPGASATPLPTRGGGGPPPPSQPTKQGQSRLAAQPSLVR